MNKLNITCFMSTLVGFQVLHHSSGFAPRWPGLAALPWRSHALLDVAVVYMTLMLFGFHSMSRPSVSHSTAHHASQH